MMAVFPLSEDYREHLVDKLMDQIGSSDPLPFLQRHVFKNYPGGIGKGVLPATGQPPGPYYRSLIRNFELSAWSWRPPLLVSLLSAFPDVQYQQAIASILTEGPYQCHPQNQPYWVCRVATELPLIGRRATRAAALAFDIHANAAGASGKRVLRVYGPERSGKTHTLTFFKYLENVQPLMLGVISVDFGEPELAMKAASEKLPVESLIAESLARQVGRRREELVATTARNAGDPYPNLLEIAAAPAQSHRFSPLSDLQQRARWARQLANELVDNVLFRLEALPRWWVIVFDNCDKAPDDAREFVRRLVERAAGVSADRTSVDEADAGQLRVVLLGESTGMLPANLYHNHVLDEDLGAKTLGADDVKTYFFTFGQCREIALEAAQLQKLTDESLARAQEIQQSSPGAAIPWPEALARAVIEKSLPLDALAEQKRPQP